MLPKNKLRQRRLERLKVYPGEQHPYEQNIFKRYDLGPLKKKLESLPTPQSSNSTVSAT